MIILGKKNSRKRSNVQSGVSSQKQNRTVTMNNQVLGPTTVSKKKQPVEVAPNSSGNAYGLP